MEASLTGWFAQLCATIRGIENGALFLCEGSRSAETAKRVAVWPSDGPGAPWHQRLAELTISEARSVYEMQEVSPRSPLGGARLGLAFDLSANDPPPREENSPTQESNPAPLRGAVVLEVSSLKEEDCPLLIERLRGGIAWLASASTRTATTALRGAAQEGGAAEVLDLVTLLLDQPDLPSATLAVATELATRFHCERVCVALLRDDHCEIQAVSHSAHFDPRARLLRDLATAMEEACDQDVAVRFPASSALPPAVAREHEVHARQHDLAGILTVPLVDAGKVTGAVSFEWARREGLESSSDQRCLDAVALLGPIFERMRAADAPVRQRALGELRRFGEEIFGPGRVLKKAALVAATTVILAACSIQATYRVTADATLEGRVQRAVVAGIDGFISQVEVAAGDVVRPGQPLVRIDDGELQVERRRWLGRREELRKEHREALASLDRSRMSILAARIAQADAQLSLLDAQLERTRLVAPFEGVVVKGDLSQSLGAPVSKGDLLFEIAPLDGYRVVLEVDERNIDALAVGQRGELVLSALPNTRLAVVVDRITPVTTASDGRNVFRVMAQLDEPSPALRPGMEGVAKIDIEERALLWIWTHDFFDRLRLWLWMWRP